MKQRFLFSGLSQHPHRCRTCAPRGQTPVLQYHFNWKMLSAMAVVTWWNFYFRLFPDAIRSPQIIEFLSHLLRRVPGKLLIVWDGFAGSSQPRHLGVHPRAARAPVGGVSSRLCARTESGRLSVVVLEAARVAKLLPAELRAVEPTCSPSPPPDVQTAQLGDRVLATSGTVFFVTLLCNAQ